MGECVFAARSGGVLTKATGSRSRLPWTRWANAGGDKGMVRLDTGGTGPHLQIDVFGTGFLVRRDGRILRIHHVAEPWWSNDELKGCSIMGDAYVLSTRLIPGHLG